MKKRYILGIVILSLISLGIYAYAGTLMDSSEVSFDNSNSNTDAETVQEAIEELYDKASKAHIIIDLGTAQTFDVKSLLEAQGVTQPDSFYQNLTVNDFLASTVDSYTARDFYNYNGVFYLYGSDSKSYNNSTFTLTWKYNLDTELYHGGSVNFHVYLIV